ncbi:MAG: hypothetical protein SGJ19_05925 [Planctomycetia bacterium]|nr:hypothetical protein [Planctomycetia bacterium]
MGRQWLQGLVVALVMTAPAYSADLAAAIEAVQRVGHLGAGNTSAQQSWPALAAATPEELPVLLEALDDSNPLAANWLRAAVDAVCERTIAKGDKLPAAALEKFTLDTSHAPRARRLAYEWLAKADPTASDRLIPGMLNDPSVEFRRDAVARLLDAAGQETDAEKLKPLYRTALGGARDLDQVQAIAGKLKELGDEVDLSRHFGFLFAWSVIGPFDNVGGKGFATAYPPEQGIDYRAEYPGKTGLARWQPHTTVDPMGGVDVNTILAKEKGVAAYLATEFICESGQDVDFRWGTMNATKLWLNGEVLAEHEVYHSGEDLDQYIARGHLKPGKNIILMKVCQNEQTENWADSWKVSLRVCDETGTAILSSDRPEKSPTQPADATPSKL